MSATGQEGNDPCVTVGAAFGSFGCYRNAVAATPDPANPRPSASLRLVEELRRARARRDSNEALKAIRWSRWNASMCGLCRSPIAAAAPVWRWRMRVHNEWGRLVHQSANLCTQCASNLTLGWPKPWPCELCGRDIYRFATERYRHALVSRKPGRFCSEHCAQRSRRGEPKEGFTKCAQCPNRIAQPNMRRRYCGNACRQQAYRDRLMARGRPSGPPANLG